jgi:hypothetical protein
MKGKKFLIILFCLLFMSPSVVFAKVIFEDNFDTESDRNWVYNYYDFANWDVTYGTVDLVTSRHPGFEDFAENGIFIDLDGTSNKSGTMQSKASFEFKPGFVYKLSFDLAGSQRPFDKGYNTVKVSLGSIYNESFTLYTADPFQTFHHAFTVDTLTNANLTFEHVGGDYGEGDCVGLLLDNVKITSTIEYGLVGREFFPGILINDTTTVGAMFAGQVKNAEGVTVGSFNVSTDHQGGPIESCGATNTLVRFKITMKFFDGRRLVMIMPYGETADANWDWDDGACPYGGRECDFYSLDNLVHCDSDENPDVSLIAKVNSIPLTKRQFGSWGFDELEAGRVEGWLIHTPPIFPVVIGTFTEE